MRLARDAQRDEILEFQRRAAIFGATDVGKAFNKFKNALHKAVLQDTEDGFNDRDRRSTVTAWLEAEQAERELRQIIDVVAKIDYT